MTWKGQPLVNNGKLGKLQLVFTHIGLTYTSLNSNKILIELISNYKVIQKTLEKDILLISRWLWNRRGFHKICRISKFFKPCKKDDLLLNLSYDINSNFVIFKLLGLKSNFLIKKYLAWYNWLGSKAEWICSLCYRY